MSGEGGVRTWLAMALAGVAIAASACTVGGSAQPDISAYLLDAEQFPAGSTPIAITGPAAAAVLADVVGVDRSATVEPSDCRPAGLSSEPSDSAALVAQQSTPTAVGTLTVLIIRVQVPLAEVKSQVAQCKTFVRTNPAGASSTVSQAVISPQPATSVPGVDTYGMARIETTGGSQPGGTGPGALGVASKSYLAQRDGVRVYAAYRGTANAQAASADPARVADETTAGLDAVFAKAVTAAFG